MKRRVIILGSTGSIGTQTIEVVRHLNALHREGRYPHELEIVGLAARANVSVLEKQAAEFPGAALAAASTSPSFASGRRIWVGHGAAETLVREVECDLVVAAIVGSAGLAATLAAVELGRDVALANKETLVAAGSLIVPAALRSCSALLPVDSEHSALWQCLAGSVLQQSASASRVSHSAAPPPPLVCVDDVEHVTLTASGGPFRTWTKARIQSASKEDALRHPTWSMGAKVTIDSASLMNKGLEIIEAHWLFGIPCERIRALIHPQSIVHAMVERADGGVIAHLAAPDMRIPIQHALTWPDSARGAWPRLDWATCGKLEFEPPDHERFPSLLLAYDAISTEARTTTAGAILNAANEEAVAAFLAGHISFGKVPELVREALGEVERRMVHSLEDVQVSESHARACVASRLACARPQVASEPVSVPPRG